MKRIFEVIEKYFFIIILVAVAISLVYPNSFKWVLSEYNGINIINLLLSIVLFTMGTTLKVDDFINVFKNPKAIGVGISAQYVIMPIIALTLASAFSLDTALTIGLVLVGTVPGGTASDVITFIAKGDVALSVSLTAVSTVISPILTPIITLLLIGNKIHFNPVDMFISIVGIVIIPIILGLILNYKFPNLCEKLKDYLPTVSSIVICLIVAGVIGANKEAILTSSTIYCHFLAISPCNVTWIWNWTSCRNGQKTDNYSSYRIGISKFGFVNQPCKNPFSKLISGNSSRSTLFCPAEFCRINSCLCIQKIPILKEEYV